MIYNVMDYGATGDGVTNDTAAIQAAVNAAEAAGGGEVYVPPGTYIVSGDGDASDGCIMLYSNISLVGAGEGTTTIKLQDGSTQDISGIIRDESGVPQSNISISNFTIDGNSANTSGKVDGFFVGVTPEKNQVLDPNEPADTNITVNNVESKNNSGYGFDPHEKGIGLVIENSISHDNGLDGFTLDGQYNATLTNDLAYNNARSGFNIVTSSQGVTLNNDTASGNAEDGVIVQRGSNNVPATANVTINGGDLYDNANDGVQVNIANYVTVNDVQIHDNGEHGIRIEGSIGSVVENSTIYDDSASSSESYQEILVQGYDDTLGPSGQIYTTSGTVIQNNTIYDQGNNVTNYAVQEANDGETSDTTVTNNTIYGTGDDTPVLVSATSTYTPTAIHMPTSYNPDLPSILYIPMLGQSNAELMHITAPDGNSGLSDFESSLAASTSYSQVISMTNMAVGDSTVNGDRSAGQDPALVWWYPTQNEPGPALLNAVNQMEEQVSGLAANSNVQIDILWAQGEAEANLLGTPKSSVNRLADEQAYIQETLNVFNYIEDHVGNNVQFYIMETGNFNTTAAQTDGYAALTINKEDLGLTYVDDAQIKMALEYSNIHLAVNYSDLPMNADMPSTTPGYEASWAQDTWHLAPSSKEIATERAANFIAMDQGDTHVLDPGPDYPAAAIADLTIYSGPGVTVTGDNNGDIITGTTSADILSGGTGNDTLVGGGGGDTMTGGAGSNTFYYMPEQYQNVLAVEAGTAIATPDVITDFKTGAGGDVVNVSAMLYEAGIAGANAVAQGYVDITQVGANTVISFDPDGTAGHDASVAIATLENVQTSSFIAVDNLVTVFPVGYDVTLNPTPAPWAKDDDFTNVISQTLTGNVLVNNGNGADSDPSGLALSTVVETVTTAEGGTATLDAAGHFTYTPAVGYLGEDSFTYTLENSAGATSVGTVAINDVTPAGAFVGTTGNDVLTSGSHNDILIGLGGNDTISGGSGNDVLYGGQGGSILNGDSGNDTLYALSGNNTLNGGDDNDMLYGGAGADSLSGGNGNDTMVTGAGAETLAGGKGVDNFVFTVVNTEDVITDFSISGGEKIDISQLLPDYNPQTGNLSDFVQVTQQGANTILSVDVDGTVNGVNFVTVATLENVSGFNVASLVADGQLLVLNANTPVNHPPVAEPDSFSGYQNEPVTGDVLNDNGNGPDTDPDGNTLSVALIANGTTTDGGTVNLQANGDFTYTPAQGFYGTDKFDYTLLDGHGGTATGVVTINIPGPLIGTNGNDTITGGSNNDTINGLNGNDQLNGGSGNDTIMGGSGNDSMNGNSGNDVLHAGSGNNVMHGNDDNDLLYGGSGNDAMYGDSGSDTLVAGTGADTMTGGGGGIDVFQLNGVSGNIDMITDFHANLGDRIDISAILTGYNPATMNISNFIETTKEGSNTLISVDPSGTGHYAALVLIEGQGVDVNALIASGNLVV